MWAAIGAPVKVSSGILRRVESFIADVDAEGGVLAAAVIKCYSSSSSFALTLDDSTGITSNCSLLIHIGVLFDVNALVDARARMSMNPLLNIGSLVYTGSLIHSDLLVDTDVLLYGWPSRVSTLWVATLISNILLNTNFLAHISGLLNRGWLDIWSLTIPYTALSVSSSDVPCRVDLGASTVR